MIEQIRRALAKAEAESAHAVAIAADAETQKAAAKAKSAAMFRALIDSRATKLAHAAKAKASEPKPRQSLSFRTR